MYVAMDGGWGWLYVSLGCWLGVGVCLSRMLAVVGVCLSRTLAVVGVCLSRDAGCGGCMSL